MRGRRTGAALLIMLLLQVLLLTACSESGKTQVRVTPVRSETSRALPPETSAQTEPGAVPAPLTPEPVQESPAASITQTYVLNTNTKKFHLPDCEAVGKMKEGNTLTVETTRDAILDAGFAPCGICNP